MKRLLPSPATVIALLALTLALGGTSYAALKITGKNVQNGSLTGADVRNGSLTGADVARRLAARRPTSAPASCRARSRAARARPARPAREGPAGPQGDQGEPGPPGERGPTGRTASAHGASVDTEPLLHEEPVKVVTDQDRRRPSRRASISGASPSSPAWSTSRTARPA